MKKENTVNKKENTNKNGTIIEDDADSELPSNQQKQPIFTSIFEIFCFMILTETSKPFYFSILPFIIILISRYIYLKTSLNEIHWRYFSSLIFLFYEYLVGNSLYALFRDFIIIFLSLICLIFIERKFF